MDTTQAIEIKPKRYIAKSNAFIETKKELSVSQRNMINAMLSKVRLNNVNMKYVDFSIKEISDLMGIKVTNFEQFREVYRTLKNVELVDVNNNSELTMNSLIGETTFQNNNMGMRFELTDLARKHFVILKGVNYTNQLVESSMFNSVYSSAIWDIVSMVKNQIHKRYRKAVSEWRTLLCIAPEQYKRFFDLKKNVFDIAKKEINETTGIKVDYSLEYFGRNVSFITLFIVSIDPVENPPTKESLIEETAVNTPETIVRMREIMKKEFKFADSDIETLVNKYPSDHFFKLLFTIRNKRNLFNEIKNPERVIILDYERVTK